VPLLLPVRRGRQTDFCRCRHGNQDKGFRGVLAPRSVGRQHPNRAPQILAHIYEPALCRNQKNVRTHLAQLDDPRAFLWLSGTCGALRDPQLCLRPELLNRHWHRSPPFPGIPGPPYEWRLHVLGNLRRRTIAVLFGVQNQRAELPICQSFPNHRLLRRRQMPTRGSRRHVRACKIVVLMAGTAFHRITTGAVRAAANAHGMRMTVVALPRKVSTRVAIHAARVPQNGKHGGKGGG
jgi:hypothetical protein